MSTKTDTPAERLRDYQADVLVVDDSRSNRLKMTLAIESLGYKATAAEDGKIALEQLSERPFDLVLLDIEMPVLDGFGVLTKMLETPELTEVPVIVISAANEMENIVRAIELGAQDFLPKNFERVLFRARVESCIERKKLNNQRNAYLRQLSTEKKRVDDLLRSTLPDAAIEELKSTDAVVPRRHENVVVLMADVVNFTQFCDANPPEEAVYRLQQLVNGFEEIANTHELEKIKTIGDAFLATAGLLHTIENPIDAAVFCAFEMARVAPELAQGWIIRVGIHVGPVVAGVIGQQQHLYDLWGDTVNTAARITGLAQPGGVCVSRTISENLAGSSLDAIEIIPETLEVKGKGTMDVFHLSLNRAQ
ncbi:MAG: response regulator [Granulosicoccus sp.]|nr:response regulator [Granulosicoccus sp.]